MGTIEERIQEERDFFNYINMLKEVSDRYCIIIATSGLAKDAYVSKDMADCLQDTFGLSVNLYRSYGFPYISVIGGQTVTEKFHGIDDPTEKESSETVSGSIGNTGIRIVSYGNTGKNNSAVVEIFGENRAVDIGQGLYFVVLDSLKRYVVDSCAFRLGTGNCGCTHLLDSLLNVRKNNPDVLFAYIGRPELRYQSPEYSEGEQFIVSNRINGVTLSGKEVEEWPDGFELNNRYGQYPEAKELLIPPRSYLDSYGIIRFEDHESRFVNTQLGMRITSDQPEAYEHTVYLIGGCTVYGFGAEDNETIASCLQRKINKKGQNAIVFNYGYFMCNKEFSLKEYSAIMNSLPLKPGDAVLSILPNYIQGEPFLDLRTASNRPHDYGEVYFDGFSHYTGNGNRLIADRLYEHLNVQGFFDKSTIQNNTDRGIGQTVNSMTLNLSETDRAYLEGYKGILRDFYKEKLEGTNAVVGSAVMNCNPFTNGHRYLVEEALKQCDYLVVFLVQEDKSDFSFDDRFNMAALGVEDLNNVVVIPSGEFILSTKTFSEYFNKEQLQDKVVDTGYDLSLFAREIAPCLSITKRFVGEEPFDKVTGQYNENMKRILPAYGIKLVEIPRKTDETGEKAISASRAREYFRNGDYTALEKLVPNTTLNYLKKLRTQLLH